MNKLETAHQMDNRCMHERKRNNLGKCHWLQKLVDNGVQLDHADEAKLNILEAAHQKYNSCMPERKGNNQVKGHRLQELVDNCIKLLC